MATRKGKKQVVEAPVPSYQEKKCVRITEADNGFTVSTYGSQGEKVKIAPSMAAALKHTREMMGMTASAKGKKK